ncbi:transcriptional regulator UhpA [Celerinatantimonas sp. YJH-8]|uniref:transcriptional regulator UhpA n=1 Tax=Celerinatantimonas sp. YJH-8 TaxID=3228714 RepID=UPI0038BF3666
MIKVSLIDDHIIVRSGFAQLINLEPDIEVIEEYSSAAEARRGLPGSQTQVCIIDISMPDESGLSLLKNIPAGILCIMLSVHDSPAMVEKALEYGARGYLSKRCSPDELIQAIRTCMQGGCYLTPDVAQKLSSPTASDNPIQQLTKREKQVAELLAQGLSVKVIAAELGLSHKTVHVHRANAMSKLNVSNTVELAKYFNEDSFV